MTSPTGSPHGETADTGDAGTTLVDLPGQPAEGEESDGHAPGELETHARTGPVVVAGHPDPRLTGAEPVGQRKTLSLLLYSDDVDTRAAVRLAIGKRVASDLPPVEWTECATQPAVISAVDGGGFDVLVLDGEAVPAGGLGLCKQLKDEIFRCPPVLVLTGRPQDAWLATWSRADAAVPHPLDPGALAEAVAGLARRRVATR